MSRLLAQSEEEMIQKFQGIPLTYIKDKLLHVKPHSQESYKETFPKTKGKISDL